MSFHEWSPVSSRPALGPRGRSRPPLHRARDPWPPGWGYPPPRYGCGRGHPSLHLGAAPHGPLPRDTPPAHRVLNRAAFVLQIAAS